MTPKEIEADTAIDIAIFGVSCSINGKRLDPTEVYIMTDPKGVSEEELGFYLDEGQYPTDTTVYRLALELRNARAEVTAQRESLNSWETAYFSARANEAEMAGKLVRAEAEIAGITRGGDALLHDARLTELKDLRAKLAAIRGCADAQADEPGIWFVAETAPEAYLQAALRRLHRVIEDDDAK